MDNGHKLAGQRLAVARILAKSEGRSSVEHIHVPIQKDFPAMCIAAKNKNIKLNKLLVEVFEMGFPDGATVMTETIRTPIRTSCASSGKNCRPWSGYSR
jgi:hypothetical protein